MFRNVIKRCRYILGSLPPSKTTFLPPPSSEGGKGCYTNSIIKTRKLIKLTGSFFLLAEPDHIAADLAPLRCGYRAPYIIDAAAAVASGALELDRLAAEDGTAAKKELLKLNGVGEKVANCVVLFGLYHMEAFPIDVWIRRALKEHFPPDFDPASLGDCAGLAQQYIFYYARSHGNE